MYNIIIIFKNFLLCNYSVFDSEHSYKIMILFFIIFLLIFIFLSQNNKMGNGYYAKKLSYESWYIKITKI